MMFMKNIKLIVEYEGTNYSGWQRQNNSTTIQERLEKAASEALGEKISVIGASRTDAGVHAKKYVCNFFTQSIIPTEKLCIVINQKLPEDIVILASVEVAKEFHSRFSSKGKRYSYTILNRLHPCAIGKNYVYHYKRKLNVESMKKAAPYFLGKHDFSAFKSTGSEVKDNVRTITELKIVKEGDYIRFYVSGDGFLYNMVRIIVGTLLDVGEGKIEPQEMKLVIESKDRKKSGMVVPASGLCLEEIFY